MKVFIRGPTHAQSLFLRNDFQAVDAAECLLINLGGQTNIFDVAGLARRAVGAVGNDTGPMHITAAVGCPSVVLYSNASNPDLCGQRGPAVKILRRAALEGLATAEVEAALQCR